MDTLAPHLALVKEQEAYHEKQARKYDHEPWRRDLHTKTAAKFQDLAAYLVADAQGFNARQKEALQNLALTPDEVEGLPPELVSELSISEADKLEFAILAEMKESGGVLNLDRILIALYKRTGEIYKRNIITSKMYRMIQKGLLYPAGNRKGVYSLTEMESQPGTQERMRVEEAADPS